MVRYKGGGPLLRSPPPKHSELKAEKIINNLRNVIEIFI